MPIPGGYMGTILQVDLGSQETHFEPLSSWDAENLIGGYGIGARFLFQNQPGGVDPLGPDNWLGFTTGPLTGSTVPTGTRWMVVTKSPLTGGWGDANAGGSFGQRLKAAGLDAVYFRGISPEPVYVFIDDGEVSFHSAQALWGRDAFEAEEWLRAKYGKDVQVACIGQAGETLSLISGIVHSQGRIAGRSGVGAVMGSKLLKAVIVRGKRSIPLPNPQAVWSIKKKYVDQIKSGVGGAAEFSSAGTMSDFVECVEAGDTPILNWAGAPDQFPEAALIGPRALYREGRKKRTCWGCPIGCWGDISIDGNKEQQPEYETVAAFGSLQLVSDLKAILKSNDLCNRYGLDTISAGSAIAFAMECFERGIITKKEVGFPLRWGDGWAAARLVEQMSLRQGFGALLADGSMRAAQMLGSGAEELAIHVMGQDLPYHDPRLEPGLGLVYLADATPGRHTQALVYGTPVEWEKYFPDFGGEIGDQTGRGRLMKPLGNFGHSMQAAGACLFGLFSTTVDFIPESLSAVTGLPYSVERVLQCGERIANLRQAFNVREGINMVTSLIPERAYGLPPLQEGPNAGVTVNIKALLQEYLEEMGWSAVNAAPGKSQLLKLGLNFVAKDLYPDDDLPKA